MEKTCKPVARYSVTYFRPNSYAKKYTMPTNDLAQAEATKAALEAQGMRCFLHDAEAN